VFSIIKTPKVFSLIFKDYLWHFSRKNKILYLTFDDGPTPIITQWVLKQLKNYQAKATFFCLGKNVENNINIFNDILKKGHTIGNHTYNHLNGLNTNTKDYINNIAKAQQEFLKTNKSLLSIKPLLFRPPYGKCWPKQLKYLINKGYKPVFWDVLSRDFDKNITKGKCLKNVLKKTENGSIIVFHDSVKAFDKLKFVLPKILEYYTLKGYQFKAIKDIA